MKRYMVALSMSAIIVLMGGCGSSSATTADNGDTTVIVGAATDDYIIGGTVNLYRTDGTKISTECKTVDFGFFECSVDNVEPDEKVIVAVSGGVIDTDGNSSTNNDTIDFNGTLSAVTTADDAIVVSPMTSKFVAEATGANLIVDNDKNLSYISGDLNVTKLKDVCDEIYKAQEDLDIPHLLQITNREQIKEEIKTKAIEITEKLDENISIVDEVTVTPKFDKISFVHMADIHLTADDEVGDIFGGTIKPVSSMKTAIEEIKSFKPDLVLQTGDMVALADSHILDQDEEWFKLAKEYVVDPIRDDEIPFLFSPGNHDQAGIKVSDVNTSDPRYANGLLFKYINTNQTKTYYSYDVGSYHFIMLDPTEIPETGYRSVKLDEDQLEWLTNDIEANKDKFLVISYHQPLGSWDSDSYEKFMKIVAPYRLRTIITAGHTHDNRLVYRDGIAEYQDGAPCGDWWQTGKTPDGNPMGYAIYQIEDGKIHRFYKGVGLDKQTNLLNPIDVDFNTTKEVELKVYDKDNQINSISYAIDGKIVKSLDLQKIETTNISWYVAKGDLTPTTIDGKDHNVTFVIDVAEGADYNKTFVYRFSNERFMNIGDVIDDANFDNYYGRFVEVNATITSVAYDGNLITLKDATGEIVVWCGDSYHPEFKVGDLLTLRGQVTQFRDTKELKLISPEDVNVYGFEELSVKTYTLSTIDEAYENFDEYENNYVVASGTLTADFGSFKVIQDDSRGIAIYLSNAPEFNIGDEITVKGLLIDYYGTKEIKPDSSNSIGADGTAALPSAKIVKIGEILDNINNLIKLENLTVKSATSSSITVSDSDENNTTIYCGKAGFTPSVNEGDIINVTGIGAIYKGASQIYPRSSNDIEVVEVAKVPVDDSNATDVNVSVTSIADIYTNYDALEGSDVNISGVVTANFGNGVVVQDDTRGVYLYITSSIPSVEIGNKVNVKGEVTSYKGLIEVKVYDSNLTVDGNATVPDAKEITIAELEENMGDLVKLTGVTVTSVSTSSITVKNSDGNETSIYCGKAKFDPSSFVSIDNTIDVVGISGYYDSPQVYPRGEFDITVK